MLSCLGACRAWSSISPLHSQALSYLFIRKASTYSKQAPKTPREWYGDSSPKPKPKKVLQKEAPPQEEPQPQHQQPPPPPPPPPTAFVAPTVHHTTTTTTSSRELDTLLVDLKRDRDHERPITLTRIELLLSYPGIQPHQVLQVIDIARETGIQSGALFSLALHTLSRLASWMKPGRYMEKITAAMSHENIPLSAKDYTSTIRQLCKGSRVDGAQGVLQAMAQQRVQPSTQAFNLLFSSRAKLGHLDKCMELYGLMKEKGVAPNTTTLIILMEGFCAFGGLHYAIKMFEKFKADGYTPSTLVCNVLMKQISELGSLAQMEFFFSQMVKGDNIRPDLETYSLVYQAYKKANQLDKLQEIKTLLLHDTFVPDLEEMSLKLVQLGKAGYSEKCEKIFEMLKRLDFNLNTSCYNGLLLSYTHASTYNKRAKALTIFTSMNEAGVQPNMDTYGAMLTIYFKNRDWPNVMDTYSKMQSYVSNETTGELDGSTENNQPLPINVYSIMISCYLETANYHSARQMITSLEATNVNVDASIYENFITTLGFGGTMAPAGQQDTNAVEEVLTMVEHMKERGMEPNPATYQKLLNNLIHLQQLDKAFEVLKSLCAAGKEGAARKEISVDLFAPLVRAYCSSDSPRLGLQVGSLMEGVGVAPNDLVVTSLLFSLVRAKSFPEAWAVVDWAKRHGLDTHGFSDVVQTAQKKDDTQNKS